MQMEQIIAVLSLLGGIVAVWVNTQTKLKEIEMRVVAIEKMGEQAERIDERIEKKLDELQRDINKLFVMLQNKADK